MKQKYNKGQLVSYCAMLCLIDLVTFEDDVFVYTLDRGEMWENVSERYMNVYGDELSPPIDAISDPWTEEIYLPEGMNEDYYHPFVRAWIVINGLDLKSLDEIPAQALNERQREDRDLLLGIFNHL